MMMNKSESNTNPYFSNIPKNWSYYLIEEIVNNNGICYGVVQPGTHVDSGIPVIRVNNIKNGIIDKSGLLKIDPEIESKYSRSRLKGGELLLTLVGSIGEVAIVPNECKDWNVARAVGVIPVREDIGSKWVFYFMKLPIIQDLIQNWATTTVQVTFNLKELAKIPVLIPPKSERNVITKILGTLDDKIELNRRMNETLESIARAIFTSWFIDFDPVRAKAEGRQPEGMDAATAALFPSEFETVEGQEIPKGWQVKPIGDVLEVKGGSTPSTENELFWGGKIPFCTPKDLSNSKTPFILSTERTITELGVGEISSGILPIGTVLLSSRAPIGYISITIAPISINQGFIALIPNEFCNNYFIYGWLKANMELIIGNANGTTFLEISKKNFKPLSLCLPPKKLMKAYNSLINPIFTKIKSNLILNQELSQIRNTLLPKLLSGELPIEKPEKFIEATA